MGNEIKITNCGCGGKAQVFFPFTNNSVYMIECKKCGICTSAYETETEAIQAWNKAMSAKDINVPNKFATDTNVENKERKTKTIVHCWKLIEYLCGNCKNKVLSSDVYCSHCGVKLDWSDDE